MTRGHVQRDPAQERRFELAALRVVAGARVDIDVDLDHLRRLLDAAHEPQVHLVGQRDLGCARVHYDIGVRARHVEQHLVRIDEDRKSVV